MSNEHTPGEWSVSEVRALGDAGETFMVLGGEGLAFGLIADVTMEADAHLIAAAPKLLALLQELSAQARLPSGVSRSSSRVTYPAATFYRINAAIAKATGPTQ